MLERQRQTSMRKVVRKGETSVSPVSLVWFLLCLASPVVSSTARKLTELQSSVYEVLGAVVVGCAGVRAVLRCAHLVPRPINALIAVYTIVLLMYTVPAAFVDWRVPILGMLTRVVPVAMVYIAFDAMRTYMCHDRLMRLLCIICIIQVPYGIIAAILGNDRVPAIFQPILALVELRGDYRAGFPVYAGLYATQSVQALSSAACCFVLVASALRPGGKNMLLHYLGIVAALVLVYLSLRRASMLYVVIALGMLAYYQQKMRLRALVLSICALTGIVFVIVNAKGMASSAATASRSDFIQGIDYKDRLAIISNTWDWIREAPFGSYLGAAGPEGKLIDSWVFQSGRYVETGASMLAAEIGIAGLLAFCVFIVAIARTIYKRAKGPFNASCNVLLVFWMVFAVNFLLKEATAMGAVYLSNLLFWSVPGLALAMVHEWEEERLKLYGKAELIARP